MVIPIPWADHVPTNGATRDCGRTEDVVVGAGEVLDVAGGVVLVVVAAWWKPPEDVDGVDEPPDVQPASPIPMAAMTTMRLKVMRCRE
jgi:hypothetical protein